VGQGHRSIVPHRALNADAGRPLRLRVPQWVALIFTVDPQWRGLCSLQLRT
jgi:hypothetical protein